MKIFSFNFKSTEQDLNRTRNGYHSQLNYHYSIPQKDDQTLGRIEPRNDTRGRSLKLVTATKDGATKIKKPLGIAIPGWTTESEMFDEVENKMIL